MIGMKMNIFERNRKVVIEAVRLDEIRTGFLNHGIIEILDQIILCCGGFFAF